MFQVPGNTNTVTGIQLPVSGKYKIQVTGSMFQVPGNTNTVTGIQLPVSGKYKIQVTGSKFQGIQIQLPEYSCQFPGNTKYRLQSLPRSAGFHVPRNTNTVTGIQFPVASYRFPGLEFSKRLTICRHPATGTW
jgi:hypothetical protein